MQFYSLTVAKLFYSREETKLYKTQQNKETLLQQAWEKARRGSSAVWQNRHGPLPPLGRPGDSNAHRNGSIWEHDATENIQTHLETKRGFDWKYNQCENDFWYPAANLQQCHCAHFMLKAIYV